jgi:hypothetical protein
MNRRLVARDLRFQDGCRVWSATLKPQQATGHNADNHGDGQQKPGETPLKNLLVADINAPSAKAEPPNHSN